VYKGVSVQNFTQLGGCADFLCPFIWSCVSGLKWFYDGSNKGTATIQPCLELSLVTRAGFAVMALRQSNNRERWDRWKAKSSMLIIFFVVKRIDWSQQICLSRPNSQFPIPLWRFTVTAWKCVKTSPQTFTLQPWILKICYENVKGTELNQTDSSGRMLLY
jgi:hypothetical protein